MLEEMTKKELRQQLKLNNIAFTTKATEEELRELLKIAIDTGKAELKTPEDEHDDKEETEDDAEGTGNPDDEDAASGSTDDPIPNASDNKLDVQEEKQASLIDCMRQNMGLPPFAEKWEE